MNPGLGTALAILLAPVPIPIRWLTFHPGSRHRGLLGKRFRRRGSGSLARRKGRIGCKDSSLSEFFLPGIITVHLRVRRIVRGVNFPLFHRGVASLLAILLLAILVLLQVEPIDPR